MAASALAGYLPLIPQHPHRIHFVIIHAMQIMLGGGETLVTQDARDDADVNMQIHQMRGTGMTGAMEGDMFFGDVIL